MTISRFLDQLVRDTRHAFRAFGHHPTFTVIAVATIGMGMGFNTTLFTVMYAALFRPLPVDGFPGLHLGERRGTREVSGSGRLGYRIKGPIEVRLLVAVGRSWSVTGSRPLGGALSSSGSASGFDAIYSHHTSLK